MRATLVFITLGAFATALPTGTPDTRAARGKKPRIHWRAVE